MCHLLVRLSKARAGTVGSSEPGTPPGSPVWVAWSDCWSHCLLPLNTVHVSRKLECLEPRYSDTDMGVPHDVLTTVSNACLFINMTDSSDIFCVGLFGI